MVYISRWVGGRGSGGGTRIKVFLHTCLSLPVFPSIFMPLSFNQRAASSPHNRARSPHT